MAPIIDAPKGLIIKKNGIMVMESPKSLNVRSPFAFDVKDNGNDECEISLPFVPLVLPFAIYFNSGTQYSIPFNYANIDDLSYSFTSGERRYYFNTAGTLKNFKVWFESRSNIFIVTLTGVVRIGSGNGAASNTLLNVTASSNLQLNEWIILEDNNNLHNVNIGDWIEFQCITTGAVGAYNIGGYVEFYYNE